VAKYDCYHHMMLRTLVAAVIAVGLTTRIGSAEESQQHLLPETGSFDNPGNFDDYYVLVREACTSPPFWWPQVVVLPSFEREEVVRIEGPDFASAQLTHCRATRSIWNERSKHDAERVAGGGGRTPVANISVPVERHKAPIDEALKLRLARAWMTFLRMTQYGPLIGNGDDGTMYHFTALAFRREVLAGRVWDPPAESLPGRFVALARLLAQYADASVEARPALQMKIDTALRRIERELALDPPTRWHK
jgi:hypothetical protein